MDQNSESHPVTEPAKSVAAVKMFGIGSAGLTMLSQLRKIGLPDAALIAVGADSAALAASGFAETIVLEAKAHGPGAGGDPEAGRVLAEENSAKLKQVCEGAPAVFILAGLGGCAGTGVSPVLARVAKEAGARVLAFVTLPFECEGNRRCAEAEIGWEQLRAEADGVICLPNQKMFKLLNESTSVLEAFQIPNGLLTEAVAGIWRLVSRRGLIEIHFDDLCALLRCETAFATAEAEGATRSRDVLDKLLAHPMLEGGQVLAESSAVLVNLVGGPDLTMTEVNRVMEQVTEKSAKTQIIMGASIDETFRERLAITLVAARGGEIAGTKTNWSASATGSREGLEAQLLNPRSGARPQSRFVPPPPALPSEKKQQLIARQGGRGRKLSPKMRQGQLPLEIVSKGRFDKSEPTIHKGEDLDVPTYIRRGVPLN